MSSRKLCRALIGPSVLACDLSCLANESKRVIESGADYLHLDVMDGHFVPNLSFGAPVIKSLRNHVIGAVLDVHLMVSNPMQWVPDMKDAGADVFTFHIEVEGNISELIHSVKDNGMKVGIALKPGTPLSSIVPYISLLDQVLIMTVEPGFGGQSFNRDMLVKIKELREMFPDLNIMVDGGINTNNIEDVAKAGANMIVAGTSVFKANDCAAAIGTLKRSLIEHGFQA